MHRRLSFLLLIFLAASCVKEGGLEKVEGPVTPYYLLNEGGHAPASHAGRTASSVLTSIAGTYSRTPREATQMDMPVYPRFIKTTDGRYLMFYHSGIYIASTGKSEWAGVRSSYSESDDGVNWKFVKEIFPIQTNVPGHYDANITRYYSGAHPVRLADGKILVVASYRGSTDMRHRILDNGLAIKISSDEGRSWTQEQRINVGTNWEPRPIVLRKDSAHPGRVIIYYTDSRPYIDKGIWNTAIVSSGVSYIYSDDNGKTWKPDDPLNIHLQAFRQFRDEKDGQKVYTDQMPGVIQLAGSKRLAGCGEANQAPCSSASSEYWINFAYSDEQGEWGALSGDGDFPSDRLNKIFRGAAPTIEQFVSGETILTYNTAYSSSNRSNFFYYHIGDENARNWGEKTSFFIGEQPVGFGFWGSVLCDGHLLLAGVGGAGGKQGLNYPLQTGLFYLNHDISASARSVKVDGNNTEWLNSDEALYLGCDTPLKHITLRCSEDSENLYFLMEVESAKGENEDFGSVYLTAPSAEGLIEGDVWIKISGDGKHRTSIYRQGWYREDLSLNCVTVVSENGCIAEFSIAKNLLPLYGNALGVNLATNTQGGNTIFIKPLGDNTIQIKLNK